MHGMQEVNGSIPFSSTNLGSFGSARIDVSRFTIRGFASPSSSGLGHRPFTAVTGVRVP
ncbi:conserved hypothetical protein [Pseudomonas sp. 8O]|nr:conserved hypothetical protein [Pseudomonas sp. 8O]